MQGSGAGMGCRDGVQGLGARTGCRGQVQGPGAGVRCRDEVQGLGAGVGCRLSNNGPALGSRLCWWEGFPGDSQLSPSPAQFPSGNTHPCLEEEKERMGGAGFEGVSYWPMCFLLWRPLGTGWQYRAGA